MQNKKFFIKEISVYLLILAALIVGIMGVFLASSYDILENEIKESSDAFLKIYSNEFNNSITAMDSILTSTISQGEDLAKLKSSHENERLLSSISLRNYMNDLINGNNVADAIVVYDRNYNICLDAKNVGLNYKKKNSLRVFTCEAVTKGNIHNCEWDFVNLDHETYMYKMLFMDNRSIAIYSRTSKLLNFLSMESNGGRSIALVNDKGRIGRIWYGKVGRIRVGDNISNINSGSYYKIRKNIVAGQLTIYCFTSKNSIFNQTHKSMIVVAIMVCSTLLFMLFILHYTRVEIAVPMQLIMIDMERIGNSEYENRIDRKFNTKEFQMFQETTNRMIDEIIGLKIQTYEKLLEVQDMELKSIRLRLKPHFFINALTTISSLSSQNKNDQIQTFIQTLSKNVRYMLRAGFHTVPIKEEFRHVENYFEMQELKYPGCVFYLMDLPQELEDWKIPQMLIHTFIENEYKYAVSTDETLTILIKVSRQIYKEEEILMIEIEDDGNGYPKEVLDYINGKMVKTGEKGTRIGLQSVKRMMELMYERNDLIFLENIDPHGCLNRIYVPKHAKHELEKETI